MKKLKTVFKFELSNYIQNRGYLIATAVIAVLIAVIMFLPRFIDMSDFLGTGSDSETAQEDESSDNNEKLQYVICDETGIFEDISILEKAFPDSEWKKADSGDEVRRLVQDQEAEGGFVLKDPVKYEYYVYNKDFADADTEIFNELLSQNYRREYCEKNNLQMEDVMKLVNVPIDTQEQILGKDMSDNFVYCYILVIAIFMIIILYCVMIATSVTSEKSNRSIEVLVTSTTPNSLIFGKVLAGTLASFLQVAVILLAAVGGYSINKKYWGGFLDKILNIPADVMIVFALFGVFGFIFYAFIYAAIGALVSKTEDINKSAGGIQMVIMIIYFVVLFQMSNIDGIVMKVLSFLPVSSYSAMYIRVAMGEVAVWEIAVSLIILLLSDIGIGYLAAKIYRMGTLRYGNPISIRTALKSLKDKSAE